MAHSPYSSNASVSCRLEWRPSRWVISALSLLGLFAAFSVLASGIPRSAAWPLALLVLACGVWQARREWKLPQHELFFPGSDLPVMLDGMPIDEVEVQWRGPIAFMCWQDSTGRRMHLCWWPDTLPASRRRELRLAAGSLEAVRHPRAMAP